ncbi:D-2-hydroxyacid dehydrogenase [Bacillus sp. RG28]|uniref:D-2-hydroxyacid dehydrogenase n=1 Tax=Gottfriedia endophytica TaxID=2820819 RepID=A0A940NRS8_9BACI|nr:D-2-hydroxyacid dehydrogenase [Gottfriedia endophytica]MBP0726615.1 D-2-hydroxyacid dehydrogenase [Gottfriedia endophytica]
MEIKNILVANRLYKEIKEIVEKNQLDQNFRYMPEEEATYEDFIWADAYVGFRPTPNFHFGELKWIHSLAAGVDRFVSLKWKNDVVLTRTIDMFGKKIGEYCLSYMLKDIQLHDEFSELQLNQTWKVLEPKSLQSQHVVIFGTGEIGSYLAKILSFFNMKVIGVSLSGSPKENFERVVKFDEAPEHLKSADWIISTLPFTHATNKLLDKNIFNYLHNAGFINVGRGATVDDDSLLYALENGHIRKAILDVFTVEPLPGSSEFWKMPNVIITPHISALTSPEEGVNCFLQTLSMITTNQPLTNVVNIEKGY